MQIYIILFIKTGVSFPTPVKYYFNYLKKLRTFNIEFSKAGRAFYQLDKDLGHDLNVVLSPDKIKEIQKKYK